MRATSGMRVLVLAMCGLVVCGLAMCGCKKQPSAAERGAGQKTPAVAPGSAVPQPGFDVAVKLSPRAKAELVAKHETVVVDASFVSGPKAGTPKKYVGEDGQGDGPGGSAPGGGSRGVLPILPICLRTRRRWPGWKGRRRC